MGLNIKPCRCVICDNLCLDERYRYNNYAVNVMYIKHDGVYYKFDDYICEYCYVENGDSDVNMRRPPDTDMLLFVDEDKCCYVMNYHDEHIVINGNVGTFDKDEKRIVFPKTKEKTDEEKINDLLDEVGDLIRKGYDEVTNPKYGHLIDCLAYHYGL